eukprot:297090_1
MTSTEEATENQIDLNEEVVLLSSTNDIKETEHDSNTDDDEIVETKDDTENIENDIDDKTIIIATFYIDRVIMDSNYTNPTPWLHNVYDDQFILYGQHIPNNYEVSSFPNNAIVPDGRYFNAANTGEARIDDYVQFVVRRDWEMYINVNHNHIQLKVPDEFDKTYKNVELESGHNPDHYKIIVDCYKSEYRWNQFFGNMCDEFTSIISDYLKINTSNETEIVCNIKEFVNDAGNLEILESIYDDMHGNGQRNTGLNISKYDDLRIPIFCVDNLHKIDNYKKYELQMLIEALDTD